MGRFRRKKDPVSAPAPARHSTASSTPSPNWSDLESIKDEWPQRALDAAADLSAYQAALQLYSDRDDYSTMLNLAAPFGRALAHSLYGPGILDPVALRDAVNNTLYCALYKPPDGQTFADPAQRAARLALTIMRESGWIPPRFGGSDEMFERWFGDTGNYFLLTAAIAPEKQPWAGDLQSFFAVSPAPSVGPLPNPATEGADEIVERRETMLEWADGGDTESALFLDGMALSARGDAEGALAKYIEAARLGSVEAMASAGSVAAELGRTEESNSWYEAAAKAGHPIAIFNVAITRSQQGDLQSATRLFQQAAEAGNVEGFAALTQLAVDEGDEAAEAHWARLGAEAGHTFCMARHGLLLALSAGNDVATLRRAREFVEQAADRGDLSSMSLAVNLSHQLGEPARGERFVRMVIQSGDAETIDRLRRHGLL